MVEPMTTTDPRPLSVSGVAAIFGVDPRTVRRWAREGRIASFVTPGGHLRFDAKAVESARVKGAA